MKIRTLVIGLSFGAMSVASSPLIFAQAQEAPTEPTEQSAPSYSDAELKSFAVAAIEVKRIHDAYAPKFESATSPAEQQQVQQTASQEMVRAVEKEGISVEKYEEIAGQVNVNPAIAERVREHLRSTQK